MCDRFFCTKKGDLEICTFFAHFFEHFQRAAKSAIAQLLFQNERICKNVRRKNANCSFDVQEKCEKVRISHIRSFQKSKNFTITLFSHFFKEQKNMWSHICMFLKSKLMCNPHIFKKQKYVQMHIGTFLKNKKMCDCTCAHFQREKCAILECANVQLPNPENHSPQKAFHDP